MSKLGILMLMLLLLQNSTSSSIVRRSDDTDPLATVIQQLSAKIASLEARQAADEARQSTDEQRLASLERHVAFKVNFSTLTLQIPASATFKFDQIAFNDGSAYDPVLGVFVAPFNGVYTFTFQIYTQAAERPLIDIRVNGNIVGRMAMYTEDGGTGSVSESDSMTVTVKLSHGDRVWVQSGDTTNTIKIMGTLHTFFTGALQYTY